MFQLAYYCLNNSQLTLQMPIADGMTATKMIRAFEANASPELLSDKANRSARVPIFAVSASLLEAEKDKYIDTGFDGWVMKPINFARLNVLLSGIVDHDARNGTTYQPGQWENGGWFTH